MEITSDEIINSYNKLLVERTLEKTLEDDQLSKEENLLQTNLPCKTTDVSFIRDHIAGLKGKILKDILSEQPQNPHAMEVAQCTANSIFYVSPYDVGSLYINNRIRLYIHNLNQINYEKQTNSYYLTADFENIENMFVIKVPKTLTGDKVFLIHESFVGLYGTNILRQYIPNFIYVYGSFKCSPPLIDDDTKKVATWCLHDYNSVNYVLFENVFPAITLSKYIEACNGTDFINIYLQVLYSLKLANKVCGFTHYNLHSDNIMLRTLHDGKIFNIRYENENDNIEYFRTKYIPTIIDYSFSRITIDGQNFGKFGYSQFSIYPDRDWIFHDLYKLLMFCIMKAIQVNNISVLTEAEKLFNFFNTSEKMLEAVIRQSPIDFPLPILNLSLVNYIKYIKKSCKCDFMSSSPGEFKVLDCQSLCLTKPDIMKKIGLSGQMGIPDSITEFYDITIRLQNQSREAEKLQIINSFPYQQAIKSHISKMQTLIDDLVKLRRSLKLVNLTAMSVDELMQLSTLSLTRSMYISTAYIIDKTVELKYLEEIGLSVAGSYRDKASVDAIKNIMKIFETEVKPGLDDAKIVFTKNHNFLNGLQSDPKILKILSENKEFNWYWNGRNVFDIVFGRVSLKNINVPNILK